MNFNQYFCNAERIYLMHGILELYDIKYHMFVGYMHFNIGKDKYFIVNTYGIKLNEVSVTIKAETNIESNPSSKKKVMPIYKVKLASI